MSDDALLRVRMLIDSGMMTAWASGEEMKDQTSLV